MSKEITGENDCFQLQILIIGENYSYLVKLAKFVGVGKDTCIRKNFVFMDFIHV